MLAGLDFQTVLEASPNPYMLLDCELRFVWANRAYLTSTGSELTALVGRGIFDAFPNDPADPNNGSRRLLEESLRRVIASGERDDIAFIPYRVATAPGGEPVERIWSATHTPIHDADGHVTLVLQFTQDVTALQQVTAAASVLERAKVVQRERQAVDERMRQLFAMIDQSPGFVAFLRGPDHVFEVANAEYLRLVGLADVVGKPVREVLPDVVGQGFVALLDQVYASGEPFIGRNVRLELRRAEGELEEVFVDFTYQPIWVDGRAVGILAQGYDISEPRRAEVRQQFLSRATATLAQSADDIDGALKAIVDHAVPAYADWAILDLFDGDDARRVGMAYPPDDQTLAQALEAWPVSPRIPTSHPYRQLDARPHVIPRFTELQAQGAARGPEHLELVRQLAIRSLIAVPLWHRGRQYGVLTLLVTRTHRRFGERDLPAMEELSRLIAATMDSARLYRERSELLAREQTARERAEAASRAKDDFLAMLGHELRNPLAPILTATQLVRLRGDTGHERELGVIERQAKHMVRLVDDLLDLSRIARGKVDLRTAPVEVSVFVAKAIEIAASMIEQKGHQLVVDVPARNLRVLGDEARLTQVVANLLTNAARYTDPGGTIRIAATRDGDHAVIRVVDDGVGIEPDVLPTIFDLFVQAHRERGEGGLGLGLTLVRRLVELHDGTVSATSAGRGHGTEIVVRVPAIAAAPSARPQSQPMKPMAAVSRRILVVDDNVDAGTLLAEILGMRGHQTLVAHDGASAIATVMREEPEIVILDIGLPDMNGYDVATKIRELLGARTPRMVALTGYGAEHDREASRRAGFEAHLTKPVDSATLLRVLDPVRIASA